MVDTAKERQRSELHKAIWSAADKLLGRVDDCDFAQYDKVMLSAW